MTTTFESTGLFSLPADVADAQAWAHDFAVKYVRPAAAGYDEREETPWPVIQDAARAGLYTAEFALQAFADPSRADVARRRRGDLLG